MICLLSIPRNDVKLFVIEHNFYRAWGHVLFTLLKGAPAINIMIITNLILPRAGAPLPLPPIQKVY